MLSLLTCAGMPSSLIYLPHRTVISLQGPDTIVLLERLVTNDTSDWSPGETRYGALLTPQGKVIADYLAWRTEDGVFLDVARDHAPDLAERLKLFRLRSQVEIAQLDELMVFAGLAACDAAPDTPPEAEHAYRDPRYADGRLRVVARADVADETHTIADYHADRIAHAVPEQGSDFGGADVFPAEINMDVLGGVALNKGCFVGQEVVSRMHRRGKIRKRTLRLEMTASTSVQTGDAVNAPLSIGTVTSAAPGQALAVIRVDRLASAEQAGETVTVNQTPVSLEIPAWLATERTAMEGT